MPNEIHPSPSEFTSAQIAEDPILHFFHYAHLPPTLRETSRAFFELAFRVIRTIPRNAERTVALRKLLEAKDAAVRANLPGPRDFHTNKRLDVEPEFTGLKESGAALKRMVELDEQIDAEHPGFMTGEPVEIGGHDEDRDGPVPFSG